MYSSSKDFVRQSSCCHKIAQVWVIFPQCFLTPLIIFKRFCATWGFSLSKVHFHYVYITLKVFKCRFHCFMLINRLLTFTIVCNCNRKPSFFFFEFIRIRGSRVRASPAETVTQRRDVTRSASATFSPRAWLDQIFKTSLIFKPAVNALNACLDICINTECTVKLSPFY